MHLIAPNKYSAEWPIDEPSYHALRPKNMLRYGWKIIYLTRKENLVHHIWDKSDYSEMVRNFGPVIAKFTPSTLSVRANISEKLRLRR